MEYTIRQLRDKTKEILDKAWAGEPIAIVRGKQKFVLRKRTNDDLIQNALKRIKNLEELMNNPPQTIAPYPPTAETITDGQAREKLCCSGKCIHWQWDGNDQLWRNSLSGREKEE